MQIQVEAMKQLVLSDGVHAPAPVYIFLGGIDVPFRTCIDWLWLLRTVLVEAKPTKFTIKASE